jgi:hypothetical protein
MIDAKCKSEADLGPHQTCLAQLHGLLYQTASSKVKLWQRYLCPNLKKDTESEVVRHKP